jgi:hypothetical protein
MALLNPILQRIIDRLTESASGAMNHRYTFDASVVVNAGLIVPSRRTHIETLQEFELALME